MSNRSEIACEGSGLGPGGQGQAAPTLSSHRVGECVPWVRARRERHGGWAGFDAIRSMATISPNLMIAPSTRAAPNGFPRESGRGAALTGRRPGGTRRTWVASHAASSFHRAASRTACKGNCAAEREAIPCW